MSDMNEETSEMPDELTTLKARADLMGISYHPSIGVEKLREKVNGAITSKEEPPEPVAVPLVESEAMLRSRLRSEALDLVRVRVACMNPNKKEWEGELLTVGSSTTGTISKFVPFNNEEGWHIPRMLYNFMLERQCPVYVTVKDSRGNAVRKSKLIKEYVLEVLPPLTSVEMQELAQRQAMAKSID